MMNKMILSIVPFVALLILNLSTPACAIATTAPRIIVPEPPGKVLLRFIMYSITLSTRHVYN
jgi:hypothetical protein